MSEVTKCPCGQNHDSDGLMIQCDRCLVWQHGDCVGIFRGSKVPENYFCENCRPQHKIHQEARKRRAEVFQARQLRIAKARSRGIRARSGIEVDRRGSQSSNKKSKKNRSAGGKRPKTPRGSSKEGGDPSSSRPSREQRKIERILESFRKMEDTKSKKKTSSGAERRSEKVGSDRKEMSQDRRKRGRPKRASGKRKAESRAAQGEAQEEISIRRLVALSPMYLGRKAWLMSMYRKDQLKKRLPGFEHLVKQNLPINKRVLLNYTAQQGKIQSMEPKYNPPPSSSSSKGNHVADEVKSPSTKMGREIYQKFQNSSSKVDSTMNTVEDPRLKKAVDHSLNNMVHPNGMNGKLSAMQVSTM